MTNDQFNVHARNWVVSIYRAGCVWTGDSAHDPITAVIYPDGVAGVLPTDVVVIVENTEAGPVERHRHLYRDHSAVVARYFA